MPEKMVVGMVDMGMGLIWGRICQVELYDYAHAEAIYTSSMDSSQVLCLSVLPSPLYSFGGKSAAMVTSVEPTIRITAPMDRAILVRSDIAFQLRI